MSKLTPGQALDRLLNDLPVVDSEGVRWIIHERLDAPTDNRYELRQYSMGYPSNAYSYRIFNSLLYVDLFTPSEDVIRTNKWGKS